MKTKIYFTLVAVLFSVFKIAGQTPTATRNYIVETTVKVPNKTAASQLAGLPVADANRTIKYFDGLGRPQQTVEWQASPLLKDLIKLVEYDAYGREAKKYNAYADSISNDGSFKTTALTKQAKFYSPGSGSWDANVAKTANPFSQTIYELSPLSRITEQGAPGDKWQPSVSGVSGSGHTIKLSYGTNTAAEVLKWTVTGTGATSTAYAAGKLFKTTTKDENWTTGLTGTIEDFKDKDGQIVLRRVWESESVHLDTYYVYSFNNLCYVIPPVVNTVVTTSFTESDAVFLNYMYGYHYDTKNRLTEKKIPAAGWEYNCYDKLGRIIYSRDANLSAASKWKFVKYDIHGRVIITGLNLNVPDGQAVLQSLFDAHTGLLWETTGETSDGYTTNTYPKVNMEDPNVEFHTINYYDDYTFPGYNSTYSATGTVSNKTKGLLTGTKTRILGTNTYLLTVFFYDDEGVLVEIVADHQLGGKDRTRNTFNFAGELKTTLRTHINGSTTTTIANTFNYDHFGRKLNTTSNINNQGVVTLNKLEYNEVGELKQKSLHSSGGSGFFQNTRLAYNERGWLKRSISSEFSFKLAYDSLSTPQFNGNITTQEWGSGNTFGNKFLYSYDRLNRLVNGTSSGIVMSELLAYDKMGNITTLNRDGAGNAVYTYTGSKLTSISGGGLTTSTNYTYDGNGNVTTDGRTGVALTYNVLNLPATAIKTGVNVAYTYSADLEKLKKVSNGITTNYISGIQYTGTAIDFIQTEEGIAFNNSGTYSYRYNLTDHLGNVRYTFDIYGGAVRRLQSDDYYAFGKRKSGSPTSLDNKYLYNGKELQEELGQYDYGARFYDPSIGRWGVVDPLAENHYDLNPYNYVMNNPLSYIDPFGLDTVPAKGITEEEWRKKNLEVDVLAIDEVVITASKPSGVIKTLEFMVGFAPILGSGMDLYKGIRDGDTWQIIMGAGGLVLDVATLGSASVIKGVVKKGAVEIAEYAAKEAVEAAVKNSVEKKIVKAAAKNGAKLLAQFSSKTIDDAVKLIMRDPNKVAHLFPAKHNLGSLVTKLGGQENTVRSVLNAANGKLPSSGLFKNIPVNVGGSTVFIRGNVVNGVPRLGTMFIP